MVIRGYTPFVGFMSAGNNWKNTTTETNRSINSFLWGSIPFPEYGNLTDVYKQPSIANIAFVINDIVDEYDSNDMPLATKLYANYPNPFNPTTTISFTNTTPGWVNIEIFNIKGQKVYTLVDEMLNPGLHKITWNGTDSNSRNVGSGVYFYRMRIADYTDTKRMVLMK